MYCLYGYYCIKLPNDFPAGKTTACTGSILPSAYFPSPVPITYPICCINFEPIP